MGTEHQKLHNEMSSDAYRDRITSRFYTQTLKIYKYTVYHLRNSGGIK